MRHLHDLADSRNADQENKLVTCMHEQHLVDRYEQQHIAIRLQQMGEHMNSKSHLILQVELLTSCCCDLIVAT